MSRYADIATVDRPVSRADQAIALDAVKGQVRFGSTSEDTLILGYALASLSHFEEQTGRQGFSATREYALECAPVSDRIELPRPPLIDVVSITYDDDNGDEQTFDADNYTVLPSVVGETPVVIDAHCAPGSVQLVGGASWPTTTGLQRSLRIRYTCGYGEAWDDLPPLVQGIVLMLVGHFHRNRAAVAEPSGRSFEELPLGPSMMIQAFKWSALPTHPPKKWPCR